MNLAQSFKKLYLKLNSFIGLSFENSTYELRYQKEEKEKTQKQTSMMIQLVLVAYFTYMGICYILTPNDFMFMVYLLTSVPILAAFIALVYINKNLQYFLDNKEFILFLYGISISISPLLGFIHTNEYHHIYVNNFMLPIVAIFILYGLPFVVSMLVIFPLLTAMLIAIILSSVGIDEKLYYFYILNLPFIFSALAGYIIESNKRKLYLYKYEKEELDLKIKEKEDKLEFQSRLALMGEMMDSIAHQWMQPINVIAVKAQTLEMSRELHELDETEIAASNKVILNSVQHLTETINEFRNFFRPDTLKQNISLYAVLESSLILLKDDIRLNNIKIEVQGDTKRLENLNANEFKHVFINLISNAKDAFISNNIDLSLRSIIFDIQEKSISITDTAGGIPPKIIDHVFGANFTTKEKGTGIGLYMTKQIVEKNGASIKIKNVDKGACFTILF